LKEGRERDPVVAFLLSTGVHECNYNSSEDSFKILRKNLMMFTFHSFLATSNWHLTSLWQHEHSPIRYGWVGVYAPLSESRQLVFHCFVPNFGDKLKYIYLSVSFIGPYFALVHNSRRNIPLKYPNLVPQSVTVGLGYMPLFVVLGLLCFDLF